MQQSLFFGRSLLACWDPGRLLHGSSKIFVEHAQDVAKIWFPTWGLFLESLDNFSGSESCFVFVVFAFKIKVSIILKIIQWTYQLRRKNDWCVG